jgi:hypothetical protein
MLEVRSIKIGELQDGSAVHGYTVLGCSDSIAIKLNAATEQLATHDMKLVTMDEYREMAVEAREAGNQVLDSQEANSLGRKVMLWDVPRTLTPEMLHEVATAYFGELYESSNVTVSRNCYPYGWIIFTDAVLENDKARDLIADFEAVAQSRWSASIHLAMSKTRVQRVRMRAVQRDRLDQRDALQRPAGQLKEIMVDPKMIQGAIMEEAFFDLWVDALYTKIGPRLVKDIVQALGDKVQALVEERVQEELGKKLEELSLKVIAKVYQTIDSAVDFSLSRAIEARAVEMGEGASSYGPMDETLLYGDLEEVAAAVGKANQEVDELEKTVLQEEESTAGKIDASEAAPAEAEPDAAAMELDAASAAALAKRTRDDVLKETIQELAQETYAGIANKGGPLSEILGNTNGSPSNAADTPPARKPRFREGGSTNKQADIRNWTAGRR